MNSTHSRRDRLVPLVFALALGIAGAQGCGTQTERSNPCDPGAPVNLRGRGTLTGKITLDQRSDPLGAQVLLRGTSFQASVAADGSFALLADPGTYAAVALAPGYVTQGFGIVTVQACQKLDLGEATLRLSLGAVQGAVSLEPVVQGQSANPAGTMVTLTGSPTYLGRGAPPDLSGLAPRDATAPSSVTYTALTDASGSFVLNGVPIGTYQISATQYGYEQAPSLTIEVGEGTSTLPNAISMLLNSGLIGGTVVAPGAPDAGGIRIDLSGVAFNGLPYADSRLTTSSGVFTFNPVPAGTYALSVQQAGYDPLAGGTIALSPGQVTSSPPFLLSPSVGSLQGSVRLSGSANSSGIVVSLSGTSLIGTPVTVSTTTDASGSFFLGAVPVGTGSYTLTASKQNFVPSALTGVSVLANQTTLLPSLTPLSISAGQVFGRAVLDFGCAMTATIANVTVGMSGTDFQGNVDTFSTSTSASGSFSFTNVPPGVYAVYASASNFANASTANIAIGPGATASAGTLLLLDTQAPSAPHITTPSAVTNADSIDIHILPAGDASNPTNLLPGTYGSYEKLGGKKYSNWTPAPTAEVSSLTFNFPLNANQNNTLQVRAVDCAGNAGPADFLNVTQDSLAPVPPRNVNVVNGNTRVTITWSPSSSPDTQGYLLFYGPASGVYNGTFASEGDSPINVGNVTSFRLTGLPNGTQFYVSLVAYDRVPLYGWHSAEVVALPNLVTPYKITSLSPDPVGSMGQLTIDGTTLYMTTFQGGGYQIFDLGGDPTNPVLYSTFDSGSDFTFGNLVSGNLAFITLPGIGNTPQSYLDILDVSDPFSPQILSVSSPNPAVDLEVNPYLVGNYLMMTEQGGVRVVDISDPVHPSTVTTYPIPGTLSAFGMAVRGNVASVMELELSTSGPSGGSRFETIDLSNPKHLRGLGTFDLPDLQCYSRIATLGSYVFVPVQDQSGSSPPNILAVFDTSNPSAPNLIGPFAAPATVTVQSTGDAMVLTGGLGTPYLYEGISGGFVVYDLSTPSSPNFLTVVTSPAFVPRQNGGGGGGPGGSMALLNTGTNTYLYETVQETGELFIVDVTDPANPVLVRRVSGANAVASSVLGSTVYLADQGHGVSVIDVTDPSSPYVVGTLTDSVTPAKVRNDGHYLYDVAGADGLLVYDLEDPQAPVLVTSYLPADGLDAVDVSASGGRVYLANKGGIEVLRFANGSLTQLGTWGPPATYDCCFASCQWRALKTTAIFALGPTVAVGDERGAVHIVDASTPSAPTTAADLPSVSSNCGTGGVAAIDGHPGLLVATLMNGGQAGPLAEYAGNLPGVYGLAKSGTTPGGGNALLTRGVYGYVADNQGLQVVNLSNLSLVGTSNAMTSQGGGAFQLPPVEGLDIEGTYAFVARGENGLEIYDIATPQQPSPLVYGASLSYPRRVVEGEGRIWVVDTPPWLGTSGGAGIVPHGIDLAEGNIQTGAGRFNPAYDFAVAGQYGFIATGCSTSAGPGGIRMIDLDGQPTMTWGTDVGFYPAWSTMSIERVAVQGPTLYASDAPFTLSYGYPPQMGFGLFSYRPSGTITLLGHQAPSGVSSYAADFAIAGHYAYLFRGYFNNPQCGAFGVSDANLEILDVSDPTNPVPVGSTSIFTDVPWCFDRNSGRLVYNGGFVYLAAPIGPGSYNMPAGLQIYDVSDPANPYLWNFIPLNGSYEFSRLGVAAAGKYLYLSDGGASGLTIFDISNPYADPVIVSTYFNTSLGAPILPVGPHAFVIGANQLLELNLEP